MLTKHQEQTFLCAITQKDYSRLANQNWWLGKEREMEVTRKSVFKIHIGLEKVLLTG